MTTADIARDDLTGFCLGQYALGARIGSGGMGRVFHARHRHLKRDLAVKFVAADLSSLDESQRRFELETLALGQLQHPHIVNAVDAGIVDGLQYLVTELVAGEDLAQLVQRRGALPVEEACALVRQAALGLAYSHARGFVHRDIKPSNLILNQEGCLKILDFGLVRSVHTDHRLTADGQTLGTWDFLAPEQAHDSSDVDHRCDIYSLGCTLLYLLSGGVPFGGARYGTPASKLKGHLFDTPAWLDAPTAGIPHDLLALLKRMLAKSPAQRIDSAAEVAAALAPFADRYTPQAATTGHGIDAGRASLLRRKRPSSLVALCCAWGIVALACSLIPDAAGPGTTAPTSPPEGVPVASPPAPEPRIETRQPDTTGTGTPPPEPARAAQGPARTTHESGRTHSASPFHPPSFEITHGGTVHGPVAPAQWFTPLGHGAPGHWEGHSQADADRTPPEHP